MKHWLMWFDDLQTVNTKIPLVGISICRVKINLPKADFIQTANSILVYFAIALSALFNNPPIV